MPVLWVYNGLIVSHFVDEQEVVSSFRIHLEIFYFIQRLVLFVFKKVEDAAHIGEGIWLWTNVILALNSWSSKFDPRSEIYAVQLVWIKLPTLLLELWNDLTLKAMGNSKGRFICHDESPN